ncbi:hypothetical protein [Bradyrhizobium sp. th.b2]|uniref:hypothetical protein n=1 Tax=Bradyrhizobium sp. th-b2 TaxID=172088 RepID=UPI000425D4BB|nr:hypothetical protein [Bradyrhizobium sp. th.b2]
MEIRSTQDSILRAFGLLLNRQSTPRQVKQKYTYRSYGSAIHATRCLTSAESKTVDDLVLKLKALNPEDDADTKQYQALLKELSALPVRFVPLKYEERLPRGKAYPYRSTKRGG